ncbi:MAG: glucose-6-phosphate isomerase [Oscillospiraceae bacterium]|nr:glucose-6-phosphate isomerase [Oscillospiraceae bacterium]
MFFDDRYVREFVIENDYELILANLKRINRLLDSRSCVSSDMLGWVDCVDYKVDEKIKIILEKIKSEADIVFVLGIGGSYLGAKMAIDFLKSPFYNFKCKPKILFLGNSVNAEPILDAFEISKDKNVWVIVVSKSGSTLEVCASLGLVEEFMLKKYGSKSSEKIIAITGENGNLRSRASAKKWEIFTIPLGVGGRFSVLSVAGLIPIGVSGANIEEILCGARVACKDFGYCSFDYNDCLKYAARRICLHKKGYSVEILASFDVRMGSFCEWWKQLFGESEGKNGKGIFPASAMFSADLHSLGQFIQQGSKILFETMIVSEFPAKDVVVPEDNSLISNKSFHYINSKIFEGTLEAHFEGKVPCMVLKFKNFSEFELGYLIFFFEKACALSALALEVNPFDQPGVENYKRAVKCRL